MRLALMTVLALLAVNVTSVAARAEEPQILDRGNAAEPDTLDPQKYSLAAEANILRDLFLPLMQLDAKARPIAGAAERWEANADGTVWTFHLREGLMWSDGAPVTADDFVLGMRRAVDPATLAQFANLVYFIKNAEAVNTGRMAVEALGVRAVDPRTVEITLEYPTPLLLNLLATPILFPVPTHVHAAHGEAWVKPGTMVSNGPFTLAEWRPDDKVRLVRNPRFVEAPLVALSEVRFYPIEDESAALKRFRAGELDMQERYPPGRRTWLEENMPGVVREAPQLWLNYLVINQTLPQYADVRVRTALSLLIDRDTITGRLLRNGEVPAYRLVPVAVEGYPDQSYAYAQSPMAERIATARALLAEAGYGPENPLKVTFRHRAGELNKRVAVAIQGMWQAGGITAELVTGDLKTHYNLLREQAFEIADAGWSFGAPDPYYVAYLLMTASVETNYGKWSNATYDRIARQAEATLDIPTRFGLYAEAERIALDDHALIPLFFPASRTLVQPWVGGFENNAPGNHVSRWLRLDQVTAGAQ